MVEIPRSELAIVDFEVDDQTPEDLSIAIDRLRDMPSIHDVVQAPVYGKKGRLMMHIRIVADPGRLEQVITACFHETTTIGLRYHIVMGVRLPREVSKVSVQANPVRIKVVERPGVQTTAKAEAADVAAVADGHAQRAELREAADRQIGNTVTSVARP